MNNTVSNVRLPNRSKSIAGKWYSFRGRYKIEECKEQPDKEHKAYRITVQFPSRPRIGIYPKEIALVGPPHHRWACFYYQSSNVDLGPSQTEFIDTLRRFTGHIEAIQFENRENNWRPLFKPNRRKSKQKKTLVAPGAHTSRQSKEKSI